jgi:hypothetical protein
MIGFIYIWRDKQRKMFYVGSHLGDPTDGYLSSSRWLNSEIRYRPSDFRRRIIKFTTEENLRLDENHFLKMIKVDEFSRKYYNMKTGKPPGTPPWSLGQTMPAETRAKISKSRKGSSTWNKGLANPVAAENGRKGADKVRAAATGRKRVYRDDGSWYWSRAKIVEG